MPALQTTHRRLAASSLAGILVVVLSASACGAFSQQAGSADPVDSQDQERRDQDITVLVKNNAWSSIHVYVVAGGQWSSLGVVSSQNRSDYTVPRSMLGGRNEIRLVADPIGSNRGYFSDPILVEPGDQVEWTLQNNLNLSSIMIR